MYPIAIYSALLLVALIAAITDARTGLIPNRLTLPVMVLAIAAHGFVLGSQGLLLSVLGVLVCGATPLLFHRLGAMGGGDVKLFAALGAIAGPGMGLEVQLLSLSAAFVWGLCVMAYRGRLLATLKNVGRVMLGLVWPRARVAQVEHGGDAALTSMRIGAAIFAGALISVGNRWLLGGLLP